MRGRWFVAGLLLSVVAALALLFLPGGLWESQPTAAFVLAVPVLLCVLPLLVQARWRPVVAWVSVTGLGVFVLLGLASVGLFFLPAVVVMAVGAVRRDVTSAW